jgi:hypothetical protein
VSSHFITTDCCTLSDEEVKDLVARYQAGDNEAAVPLIRSQSAWVMSMVARYTIPPRVSVEDVYSELVLVFLHGLKLYDPDLSHLSTFFRLMFSRRMPSIIRFLNDEIATDSSEFAGVAQECQLSDAEDRESEAIICDIMHTHLTAFERDTLLNYVQHIPIWSVAEKANEFVKERNPEATSAFTAQSIRPHIDRAIDIIKEELRRRGDLESASLQKQLF